MKTYTINQIAKELNTNKSRVRWTLDKLNIEALNEKTRPHTNTPKEYSEQHLNAISTQLAHKPTQAPEEPQKSPTDANLIEAQQEHITSLKAQVKHLSDHVNELTEALKREQTLLHNTQQKMLELTYQSEEENAPETQPSTPGETVENKQDEPQPKKWYQGIKDLFR